MEAVESRAGITRLGHMAATESIARNLQTEDDAYRRDLMGTLNGSDQAAKSMHIMAARDVYVNDPPKAAPSPTPTQPALVSPAVVPPEATSPWEIARKAALAAALLGLGGGAGATMMQALRNDNPPPPVVQPADDGMQQIIVE